MSTYAVYMDGKTSKAKSVIIGIDGKDLLISDLQGIEINRWALKNVHYVGLPKDGQKPRLKCGYDQPARLTLSEYSERHWLEQNCKNLKRTLPGWNRYWRPVALWGSGALVSLATIILIVIPFLAKQLITQIPYETEQKIGAGIIRQIGQIFGTDKKQPYCKPTEAVKTLYLIADKLNWKTETVPELTIQVLKSETVNAFALPGGNIVLTTQLLKDAETLNEIMGIIGHEIGHLQERHSMQAVFEKAGYSLIFGLLVGDIAGGFFISSFSEAILGAAFSRDKERAADTHAIRMMNENNFSASAMADFFNRISDAELSLQSKFGYLLSHPANQERINFIKATMTGTEFLKDDDFTSTLQQLGNC